MTANTLIKQLNKYCSDEERQTCELVFTTPDGKLYYIDVLDQVTRLEYGYGDDFGAIILTGDPVDL